MPNAKETAEEEYHGTDGFGDAFVDDPDTSKLQKEHAAFALHRITSEDPGNRLYALQLLHNKLNNNCLIIIR